MHDDLVDRDFTATAPNTKWLTDLTEHATSEGKRTFSRTDARPRVRTYRGRARCVAGPGHDAHPLKSCHA